MKLSAVMGTFAVLGSAALAGMPAIAAAQGDMGESTNYDFYVAPMVLYTHADSYRDSDDAVGGYVGFGSELNRWWNVEFGLYAQGFDPEAGGPEWNEYGLNMNGLLFFSRNPAFSPYANFGVGLARTEGDGVENSVDPTLTAGLGFQHEFEPGGVALRVGTAYRFLPYEPEGETTELNEWQVTAGLVIPLGGDEPMQTVAATDSDNDGVVDENDLCPGTPAGVQVDADGCPLDSDGDGVPNGIDQCPNTPAGTEVNAVGCPVSNDNDNDGVPNAVDQCPNTPAGADVNAYGCTVLATRQLKSAYFPFDSSELGMDDREVLSREVAKTKRVLAEHPEATVEIAGHTDSVGTEEYNRDLSQERAQAVREFFVSNGIDPARITAYGYGESDPIATNETAAGRQKNRRTEVRLIGNQ